MYKKYIIVFIFILPVLSIAEIPDELNIEHVSLGSKLEGSSVTCIVQDHQGFMWFGTKSGLVRYDGYDFLVYRHDPRDSTSISSNDILSLYVDRSGILWAGTLTHGLNKFDQTNGQFKRYVSNRKFEQSDFDKISGLSNNQIHAIHEDRDGNLWIGTSIGLNYFDPEKEVFGHYFHNPDDPASIRKNDVRCFFEDSKGRFWIGTLGGGLHILNRGTGQFRYYMHDPDDPQSINSNFIFCIIEDRQGTLWIGTNEGLNKFVPGKDKFIRYVTNKGGSYPATVYALHEDSKGTFWVGAEGDGINIFDRQTGKFHSYRHNPEKANTIGSDFVTSLYEDRSGAIWIGTGSMWGRADGGGFGIDKFDRDKDKFHSKKLAINNFLAEERIKAAAILIDSLDIMWLGTVWHGLLKYDLKSGQIKNYRYDENDRQSLSGDIVFSLFEDRTGVLWVGTAYNGLNAFNRNTEKFSRFLNDPDDSTSISDVRVTSILEDSFNQLWVCTFNKGGLNLLDRQTGKFTHFSHDPEDSTSVSTDQVSSLFEDKSHTLWIGSWGGGLHRFNRKKKNFTRFNHSPDDLNSISHNIVRPIHEDKTGTLWIGTEGGLNKFNRDQEQFTFYSEKDGLPDNSIYCILEDDHNRLWLGTGNGLSCFDIKNHTFKNYSFEQGLINKSFIRAAKRKNGEMYFRGDIGIDFFHPDSIRDNQFIPPVFITRFTRYNNNIDEGKPVVDNYISEKSQIELTYQDQILTFEFSALNYRNPKNNLYAYKMDGFNDSWIKLGTKRDVTFTDLDPGEYTFHVRGSNNDGVWNEQGTSLKINIAPPWWRTNWAYGFYIFAVISILLAIRAYELKRQRLKYELEMEHEQAENLKELDHMKSRFFASISHEFRTPLTLINGPVERLQRNIRTKEYIADLDRIRENAGHMNKLVEMYLDLSRLESGTLTLQKENQDIIDLLQIVLASFESRAEAEQKKLYFNTTLAAAICHVDKNMFSLIMNNLLSNALKFTGAGGEIKMSVGVTPLPSPLAKGGNREESGMSHLEKGDSGGCVVITISDSGIGIPEEELDRVFDMYYQVDNEINKRLIGTGIGLSMVKELVTMHDGTVDVESTLGQGTTFTIIMPLIEAAEKKESEQPQKSVAEAEPEIEEESSADESKELILIVEDNHKMLEYIKSNLDEHYRTASAANGKQGLEKAVKLDPQLIISDVMMPEMDGYELCAQLKQDFRTSHIPVILLTAKTEDKDMLTGLESGADAYLKKPFKEQELLVRIRNLIDNRRRLHRRFLTDKQLDYKTFNITSADERFLELCQKVVEGNLNKEDFTVDTFASELAYSRVQLHRKLKALTGLSASGYIKTSRLKKAAALLESGFGNISEISYECGFTNHAHFARLFKEMYNLSPSQYARKHKKSEL